MYIYRPTVCTEIYSMFNLFVELENRCIMAALPYVLEDKSTHKHTSGEHSFEVVLVSEFCIFYNI